MEELTGEGLIARFKYWLDNAGYHIIEYNNGNSRILRLGTPLKQI